ncbi:hypothetical protein GCK32_004384 [Trichostrongylus colubriformis]|uniref:Uncharacterized protein n=1 Tax=Trichostrongylus colubriformis TaxID=6319 RepID=A0AAN8FIG1_TRICO
MALSAPDKDEERQSILHCDNPGSTVGRGKYSRHGVCIDDTFNLTRYSLRLATVIVADEYDMGLPGAYLLSHRMTEDEVYQLLVAIKRRSPNY